MLEVELIPIENIRVGEHDQRLVLDEDEVARIASSIARVGLLYPIIVRRDGDQYLVLDGHTRLAAHKRLGMEKIKCTLAPVSGESSDEIAFAGNFFRKDLSSVELAAAIEGCYKTGKMTIKEMAAGFHKSEHWVQSMIAICDWPADVLEAIHNEAISVSAGSNLAIVTDDSYRAFLVRNAVEHGATARTTAAWLQAWRSMESAEEAVQAQPAPGPPPVQPLAPQGPCFVCAQVFPVNMMSHVPCCGNCVQTIRNVSAG